MNVQTIVSLEPFQWVSVGICVLCGSIIGLERQLKGKPVGIRTSSLIVLGTYLFVTAALGVTTETSDSSRVIGQVVTGVGFLGAGVMMAKEGVVVGVTSAATIWVLAAIGVCVAVVSTAVAVKISVLVVAILYGVDVLENYSSAFTRGVHSRLHSWRKQD